MLMSARQNYPRGMSTAFQQTVSVVALSRACLILSLPETRFNLVWRGSAWRLVAQGFLHSYIRMSLKFGFCRSMVKVLWDVCNPLHVYDACYFSDLFKPDVALNSNIEVICFWSMVNIYVNWAYSTTLRTIL